jgi:virulence-associated protein VapD
MWAILFDLYCKRVKRHYHNGSWRNAWTDIGNFLWKRGFKWKQGSVYFGDHTVNKDLAERALEDLGAAFPWFSASVKDIRILKVDSNNDGSPSVARGRMLSLAAEVGNDFMELEHRE